MISLSGATKDHFDAVHCGIAEGPHGDFRSYIDCTE